MSGGVGGRCTLTCSEGAGVYVIEVTAGGTDWFVPYAPGMAGHCDVPRGMPNGTLVVTYPMNGCALEVHSNGAANRFYHDADGSHMPNLSGATAKCRIDISLYEGFGARAETIFSRYTDSDARIFQQNFEHTIICVKTGVNWNVYQTAVVTTICMRDGQREFWQIKHGPPVHLGVFED
ncbi:hypothetical protein [Burkholderia ubonensis]|uniref:hypothetical protein n=1 Tax=Burkholderia ubonensis TaxID=101571 RepID=UPI0012FBD091|nr:hypothetical protein [Burkholderia ubonensis]